MGWEGWWGDSIDVRYELAHRLQRMSGGRALDVGCGHGVLLSVLHERCQPVGVDGSVQRLHAARELTPRGWYVCADVERLPFRDRSFDSAILAGVIEYVKDRDAFLRQISCLVSPGGQVLATTHNRGFWAYHGHPRLLSLGELEEAFGVFTHSDIRGYNPLPSVGVLLPHRVRDIVPPRWQKLLALPAPLAVFIPGAIVLLRLLMRYRALRRWSKSFLVLAQR